MERASRLPWPSEEFRTFFLDVSAAPPPTSYCSQLDHMIISEQDLLCLPESCRPGLCAEALLRSHSKRNGQWAISNCLKHPSLPDGSPFLTPISTQPSRQPLLMNFS